MRKGVIFGNVKAAVPGHVVLGPFRFSLEAIDDLPDLAGVWRELEARAEPSYFQSWGWIGTWLEALPARTRSRALVLRVERGGEVVGLGLLIIGQQFRHGFVFSRTLALSETGDETFDAICIEHNGLLSRRADAEALHRAIIPALEQLNGDWNEIMLGGLSERNATAVADSGAIFRIKDSKPSFLVDLKTRDSPLIIVGRSTRYQIRRSLRDYGRLGTVITEQASTHEQASAFLSALERLHQMHWQKRGRPGAFASPFFTAFHRRLVADRLRYGEIQLLRTSAGGQDVGYLYNFVYRGRVLNYQSGFDYRLLPHGKPGLLCHVQAIALNRERGAGSYDLLAGANQLKRSLASHTERMDWLVVRRDTAPLRLEDRLRRLKNRLARLAAGEKAPDDKSS